MTPEYVADVAYSALHNTKSRILPSQYNHIQRIAKTGDPLSAQSFIGNHGGSVSAKSVYPTATARITKSTTDGPAAPSSNFSAQGVDTLRQSAGFSDLRGASGTVKDSIQYPKKQAVSQQNQSLRAHLAKRQQQAQEATEALRVKSVRTAPQEITDLLRTEKSTGVLHDIVTRFVPCCS